MEHPATSPSDSSSCTGLEKFEVYGWKPRPNLSDDDNLMDLVMLVTRSSTCRQGSMACILAKPVDDSEHEEIDRLERSIISVATNSSLFKKNSSDIHAEINAIGQACQKGSVTLGCTAYITMPPCKNCFGALIASGVKKIVSRVNFLPPLPDAAKRQGVELVLLGNQEERMARIKDLVSASAEENVRDAKRQRKE